MKKNILKILLVIFLINVTNIHAQETRLMEIRNIMADIYKTYDNIPSLSFSVNYNYGIYDSTNVKKTTNVIDGKYNMNVQNAVYSMGEIEYIQNRDFFIALHHKHNAILVSNPQFKTAGGNIPMRTMLDSLILKYAEHYNYNTTNIDTSNAIISFSRKDSLAQFDTLLLGYNKLYKRLTFIQYNYKQAAATYEPQEVTSHAFEGLPIKTVNAFLRISFNNYETTILNNSIYETNSYIWNDNGSYKPIDKYKYYKIYDLRTVK